MKLKLLIIPCLMATALFAQDPGGFGGQRGYNRGPQVAPGTLPPLPAPDGIGPGGDGIMIMRRGQMQGQGRMRGMGMRGMGMNGQGMGMHGGMGMGGQGMRGMGMGQEAGLGRLLSDPTVRQQVGVTADQAAKIRQQESDFQKAQIRNKADLQIKRLDLNDLLSTEKPDRAAIDSKVQEIGAAQTAIEKSAIDNTLNMREALTPAQRQKLQQLMAQRRQAAVAGPAPGANAAPRAPQGAGRGGRGIVTPPNQQAPNPQTRPVQ